MKAIKKMMALVIAIMMVAGMTTVAHASTPTYDGKITITNATVGQKYSLYKVFDATVVSGRTEGGNGINYTKTGFTGDNTGASGADQYFTVDSSGNIAYVPGGSDLSSDAIGWLKGYATASGTLIGTETATTATVEWQGLEPGYYFISTTTGTAVTVTSITPDVTVTDKNVGDTIDKKQKGGDHSTDFTDSDLTAHIGDIIEYQLTVKIQPNTENAVVYDTLDAGLTLQGTAPTVSIDATNYKLKRFAPVAGDVTFNYTESPSGNAATKTVNGNIVIAFEQSYIDSLSSEATVTITYQAMINSDAQIATDIPNTVNLVYGHNYDMTQNDQVKLKTYKITLTKQDGDSKAKLAGAEFDLYPVSTGGTKLNLVLVNGNGLATSTENNVYRVATSGDSAPYAKIVTGTTGIVEVLGLQNGEYFFEETKAPDGYNKLTARTRAVTIANADATIDVDNAKGTVLPSTGGMGTTILYIIGALLLVGAGVLLVTRKRMAK